MLRKGDQGADRPDPQPGYSSELNTEKDEINREELLSQDEKAQKFFAEIQKLKRDLDSLKRKEVLNVDFDAASGAGRPASWTI